MYDVIIIGAGPAGISASLYAKRSNLSVLVLYNGESNLEKALKIENYYGFINGITGRELFDSGIKQAEKLGVEVIRKEVVKISNINGMYGVETVDEIYEGKAIILATGNKKILPNIKGIKEFEGKGVSFCAICDAFFYRGKSVVVIGNGKFAVSEANELSHVANKVVVLTDGLEKPECEFNVNSKKIKELLGNNKIEKVKFEDNSEIDVDGVFIALGEAGASNFAKTLGLLQNDDNIKVNDRMETNVEGIYACGDATGGLKQICKSVYEGAQAGISASEYARKLI
ncbi:MAG: NAD(P)/FAD-dependent oxidoreductase [Clostridia bacterium]|nr:NAD(P)/FAD-dependent oxidoreductase [Clostridia bacterium]